MEQEVKLWVMLGKLCFLMHVMHICKAGIADIQKTPEPFRVTRNLGKGRFEGHFIHCAQPDYKGIMMNGQGIIFEAKYTDHDRIMQNAVTETQVKKF